MATASRGGSSRSAKTCCSSIRGRSTRRCSACSSGAGFRPPGARPTTIAARSSTRSPARGGNSSPPKPRTGRASPRSSAGCCGSRSGSGMLTRGFVLLSHIRAWFASRPPDHDFDQELATHLAMAAEDNIGRGMPPDEARRAAIVRFGGPMQIKEQQHDDRGLPFVDATLQDVRYGLRALRKYPAYSIVAVATLAIGIGAGTAVFSIARAVLLRPLPYDNPGELVRIFEPNPLKNWTRNIAAPANYADRKRQNSAFTDTAAYEPFNSIGSRATDVFLTGYGEPQGLKSLGVTGNLFKVLGAAPLMGRTFVDEETFEGNARVVILSYGTWQSVFGADPGIIGRA